MEVVLQSRENRFLHIDGLRALSVIWMIAFHSIFYLGFYVSKDLYLSILENHRGFRLLLDGFLGVDVFFAISGFLIASILLNDLKELGFVRLGRFYVHRFFRIFPVYLSLLLLCRCLVKSSRLENIWANIFLINNYISISHQAMGWIWSLAVEWQFYVIFPLLLIVCSKLKWRPVVPILLITLGSLLVRYFVISKCGMKDLLPFMPFFDEFGFSRWFDSWYDKTHLRLAGLLVGSLSAFFYLRLDSIEFLKKNKIFLRIILIFGAIYFMWSITSNTTCVFEYCSKNEDDSSRILYETMKHFMTSLIAAGIVLYCSGPGSAGFVNKLLSSKVWRPFSELSLSAYLVHPIVIVGYYNILVAMGYHWSKSNLPYLILAIELMTFFISFIVYSIIESPFRKLGRRIADKLVYVKKI